MQELLAELAKGIVKEPEAVSVSVNGPDEEGVTVYHLHVSQEDMGRVIGKQGKIAKSIRTIMKATAIRNGQKIQVEID